MQFTDIRNELWNIVTFSDISKNEYQKNCAHNFGK